MNKQHDKQSEPHHRPSNQCIPPFDTRPCYKSWKVTVQILSAKKLIAADSAFQSMRSSAGIFASSDPMVFMEVEGCTGRSSVINESLNPKWNDPPFVFHLMLLEGSQIEFLVYDWDQDGKHDFLGQCALKFQGLSFGTESEFTLNLQDDGRPSTNEVQNRGSLTFSIKLDVNFSLGQEFGKLYLIEQIRNVRGEGDTNSLIQFAYHLISLGMKEAHWLAASTLSGVSYLLDQQLSKVLEKAAHLNDGVAQQSTTTQTLHTMSLEATLDGISEIALHCGRCISLVRLADRHAPNCAALMTIVLNVHMSRVLGELNRWCYNRLDTTMVLNGDPRRQTVRTASMDTYNTPLGETLPVIIRFLTEENEIIPETLDVDVSLPNGIFEKVLVKELGKFGESDFQISFTKSNKVKRSIKNRCGKLTDMFDIKPIICNEVNFRGGARGRLNLLLAKIIHPYEDVVDSFDGNTIMPSTGGVISKICGAAGWAGLSGKSDWATDSLEVVGIEIRTAKNLFKPSPSVLARHSTTLTAHSGAHSGSNMDGWDAYRMLMLPVYQIVAHSLDALVYRFLYLFKELRALEADFQSKASILNSTESLAMTEVPEEEVDIILNTLCLFIRDAARVKLGISTQFVDVKLGSALEPLSDRLNCSLEALELAAVNQLSYLVLKCFSVAFAKNRILILQNEFLNSNVNIFDQKQENASTSTFKQKVQRRKSGFHLLTKKIPKTEIIEITWTELCDEIFEILEGTIPILKSKLTLKSEFKENDKEKDKEDDEDEDDDNLLSYYLSKAKNLICESLVLKLNNFFMRSILKEDEIKLKLVTKSFFSNFKFHHHKKKSDNTDDVALSCLAFNQSIAYLCKRLFGDDDSETQAVQLSCLGDGPWRSRFDWLLGVSALLAETDFSQIVQRHNDICEQFRLHPAGPMLDLTIYYCSVIRGDDVKVLSPMFESIILKHIHYVTNADVSVSPLISKAADIYECSSLENEEHLDLIISTKGIKGMVVNLISKYQIKDSRIVLKITDNATARARARSQVSTFSQAASIRANSPPRSPPPSSSSTASGGKNPRVAASTSLPPPISPASSQQTNIPRMFSAITPASSFVVPAHNDQNNDDDDDDENDNTELKEENTEATAGKVVQIELQVEVVAASRLRNLEEKNNNMSSPFVRCSLLRNYLRHKKQSTYKKYNLMNSSSSSSSSSSSHMSKMNISLSNSMTSSSTPSHIDSSNYSPSNLYEYFDTCTIANNLNPRWRLKKQFSNLKNDNFGTFKIGNKDFPFWGLALQVDVLSNGNKLLGTVTIDLFEWDKTSCGRKNLTAWFPLHLQHRTDFAGSIALSIRRQEVVDLFESAKEDHLLAQTL